MVYVRRADQHQSRNCNDIQSQRHDFIAARDSSGARTSLTDSRCQDDRRFAVNPNSDLAILCAASDALMHARTI